MARDPQGHPDVRAFSNASALGSWGHFEMSDVDVPHELARLLAPLRGTAPLVLASTLDALPLARHLALALHGDLDVLLVEPIGGPATCLGWADEHGHGYLKDVGRRSGPYAAVTACRRAGELLAELRERLTPGREARPIHDRVVVLVDDRPGERERLQVCVDAVRRQVPELVVVASVRARDAGPPDLRRVDFQACVPTRRRLPRPRIEEDRARGLLTG
jgi:predicted phosphoribosyltransferase